MSLSVRPDQEISRTLDGGFGAPAQARAMVDALPQSLTLEQRYDLRLALSELVANSVVHGSPNTGDAVDVRIVMAGAAIRCEVSDHGPGFETGDGRAAVPDPVGGLGLILVDRIAARWGADRVGRTVWFELARAA